MKHRLEPHIPDPFEVFHSVHRDKRLWQFIAATLLATTLSLVGMLAVVAARHPIVIVKDRLSGAPPIIVRGPATPEPTVTDAQVFFLNMLRLRYGWDSLTVERDMEAFRRQCHSGQRQFERRYLDEMVTSGDGVESSTQSERVPRKMHWVKSQIRNQLIGPAALEDIACQWTDEQIWHCHTRATVVTQKLFPPYLAKPPQRRAVYVASLLPVAHTIDTPYGLLVGAMRELPEPEHEVQP